MSGMNLQLFGEDMFGEPIKPPSRGELSDRFLFPPFSVLDKRSGGWQNRKRAWISLGIKSELGRAESAATANPDTSTTDYMPHMDTAISIFDPVLCEIMYSWFCPNGGLVVDPFAGGSVRGIVAGAMGMDYWGCELSGRQVEANRNQAVFINATSRNPQWIYGDSLVEMNTLLDDKADFIFTCPPYGDLEVYSDDPRDLSTMTWGGFCDSYGRIIEKALTKLKPDRFACFVVGNYRNETGNLLDLVGLTVRAFQEGGASFYNDCVLLTPAGTAPIRASAQFDKGRKLCKTHQNVLVFCKGDPKMATANIMEKKKQQRAIVKETPKSAFAPVKISTKWLLHKFSCTYDYIISTCHGRCCEGSKKIMISLLSDEQQKQIQAGFDVKDGFLQPDPETNKCPHKTEEGLCGIHETDLKPFGCVASPFTLNEGDTLIVRHRYSKLKCHGHGEPAYKTFRASLNLMFGDEEAERISNLIDNREDNIVGQMPISSYEAIKYLDNLKKPAGGRDNG